MKRTLGLLFLAATVACHKDAAKPEAATTPGNASVSSTSSATTEGITVLPAKIGDQAPEFALADLDGAPFKLREHKGKIVVLEWFNPGCPFVKAAHTKGSLVGTAKKHTANGVIWVAINSGAPGKQGADPDANREGKKAFGLEHPIVLDPTGVVGRSYGATNTPHLVVIDRDGKIAYRGAIDNSPDAEGGEPQGGKLVNYVDQAVAALLAGKTVEQKETKAYGCSVKYGG